MTLSPDQAPVSLSAPVLTEALFWTPRFQSPSPVLGHAPFLFWIMEMLRPSTVLGVGLRSAEGYFALCQASDKLGLSARAWGFGTWDGPETDLGSDTGADPDPKFRHASGRPTVPQDLRAHNAQYYADISRLAYLSDPQAALARFDADMFDLILVDGTSVAPDPAGLATALVHHATGRGAVLVLGTALPEDGSLPPARALVLALANHGKAIFLDDHDGCALVLLGQSVDPRLTGLALYAQTGPEFPAVLNIIRRLGQGHLDSWYRRSAKQTIGRLEATHKAILDDLTTRLHDLQAAQDAALRLPQTHAAADATTGPAIAQLQEQLAQGHALRLHETRVLTAALERLTEEKRTLAAQVDTTRDMRLDAAEAELAALTLRHFEELTDLQTERDWLARALDAARSTLAQCQSERDTAQTALTQSKAELTQAQMAASQAQTALAAAQTEANTRLAAQNTTHKAELTRQKTRADEAAQTQKATHDAALQAAHDAHEAQMTAQAAHHRAELDQHIARASAQTAQITHLTKTLATAQRAQATGQAQIAQLGVKLKLAQWQAAWSGNSARTRLGKRQGPFGGDYAQELATIAQSPHFDPQWYLSAYPDLQDSKLPPAEHFLRHGLFEGRNPGPAFRTLDWFLAHPEALENRRNPLLMAE